MKVRAENKDIKRVAIVQSNYIPWKGYFDLINSADEFVIYDDMQYTKRDWRNRNKIKTSQGLQWLTIPVEVKGKFFQKVNETTIADGSWSEKHYQTITTTYKNAPFFNVFEDWLKILFSKCGAMELLTNVNQLFIEEICKILEIGTTIRRSEEFELREGKSERLLGLCKDLNADVYISGPAAKGYLDESLFLSEGIAVEWMDYSGYPNYPQLFGEFEHGVTVLDLLLCTGSDARDFMKKLPLEKDGCCE